MSVAIQISISPLSDLQIKLKQQRETFTLVSVSDIVGASDMGYCRFYHLVSAVKTCLIFRSIKCHAMHFKSMGTILVWMLIFIGAGCIKFKWFV